MKPNDHIDDTLELQVIETDMLPEARESLAWLISPDYKAEDNADHEFRDSDIESLTAEIVKLEACAARLTKRII